MAVFSESEWLCILIGLLVLVIVLCIGALFQTQAADAEAKATRAAKASKASGGAAACRFMTLSETQAFLAADADGYVRRMTSADLYARHVDTRSAYIDKSVKAATDVLPAEQRRLRALCRAIDARLRSPKPAAASLSEITYDNEDSDNDSDFEQVITVTHAMETMLEGFNAETIDEVDDTDEDAPHRPPSGSPKALTDIDLAALAAIPWVIAKTTTPAYEDGLPHTRADVIFLSSTTLHKKDTDLARTLLHEKVHLYQRKYPQETAQAIADAGYHRTDRRRTETPLARANPDLDDWVYEDPAGVPMLTVYNSAKPSSIGDVTGSNDHEHPYETMAYSLAAKNIRSV
jgi:hypothetical protein